MVRTMILKAASLASTQEPINIVAITCRHEGVVQLMHDHDHSGRCDAGPVESGYIVLPRTDTTIVCTTTTGNPTKRAAGGSTIVVVMDLV